ncbi:MAG TPA: hypothetical protein VEC14_03375 [Reyranellaceae bacterium]|nr:hypothetical protein [Reyranellaceae bacterium]
MAALSPEATRTLVAVAELLKGARDPWWVLGGAAVALHGLDIEVADVDVLMSARDLGKVLATLGIARQDSVAIDRFRSDIWARWTAQPLTVDLIAGFQVKVGDRWTAIAPKTREVAIVEGRTLHVPGRDELIEILQLFGRPKDVARAEGLARL